MLQKCRCQRPLTASSWCARYSSASSRASYRMTLLDGVGQAPRALIDLLKGRNIGKYLVRVGPDPA